MNTATWPPMLGIPAISDYDRPILHAALTRYYVARGLADVDLDGVMLVSPEITAGDKAQHAHLLTGCVNDSDIVEFMHSVSGLPRSLCATWNYLDNVEMTRQGSQPAFTVDDCYEFTLEVVNKEGAAA